MTLKEKLKEAGYVHGVSLCEINIRLDEAGLKMRPATCQQCKYSELAYSNRGIDSSRLVCRKLSIYVSAGDSCQYSTMSDEYIDLYQSCI